MSQSKGSARWLQHPTLAPLRVLGLRSPSQQTATLDRLTHKPPLYHRRYPAQGELAATGLQPIRDPANPANTKERLGISTPWYCTYSVYCTRYVWCCTVLYCNHSACTDMVRADTSCLLLDTLPMHAELSVSTVLCASTRIIHGQELSSSPSCSHVVGWYARTLYICNTLRRGVVL